MTIPSISILIPAKNETANLPVLLGEIQRAMQPRED